MNIAEIVTAIEVFAAPELQEDYDNAGLITGNANWECTGVLCCLDVTREVLDEAEQKGCNLVVAHHPLIFRGIKKLNGKNEVERLVIHAIKNDIAIYAAHTNLDNVLLGVSGRMAEKLNLKDTMVLAPKKQMLRRLITFAPEAHAEKVRDAVFAAGAGKIGNYSECSFNTIGEGTFRAEEGANPFVGDVGSRHKEQEIKIEIVFPFYLEEQVVKALVTSHPYEVVAYDIFTMENRHLGIGSGVVGNLEAPMEEKDFLGLIAQTFQAKGLRHSPLTGRKIRRVAVCGGAGSFLAGAAAGAGADIYITSDMKYHEFFEAEGKLVLADIGHYESEQFTVDLLHDLLVEKFPTFAVLKTGVNTNPIRYFGNPG